MGRSIKNVQLASENWEAAVNIEEINPQTIQIMYFLNIGKQLLEKSRS